MPKLLLASNNRGKLKELQALLSGIDVQLIAPAQLNLDMKVEESGRNYAENAAIKARAFASRTGMLTLADDSGLEVAALGGAPGLHSARYSPKPGATDADRRAYLLRNLADKAPPWTAHFRCVIALFDPSINGIKFAEGICPGEIIPTERGEFGFGYDPIFLLVEKGLTMAELNMQQKNELSHRARAVNAIKPILLDILSNLS
jgi:XTP/dITP diphosphohydrolase